jgi:hypothetical protein
MDMEYEKLLYEYEKFFAYIWKERENYFKLFHSLRHVLIYTNTNKLNGTQTQTHSWYRIDDSGKKCNDQCIKCHESLMLSYENSD